MPGSCRDELLVHKEDAAQQIPAAAMRHQVLDTDGDDSISAQELQVCPGRWPVHLTYSFKTKI